MTLRNLVLTALGAMLLVQLSAVTIDDLQDIYYYSESALEEYTPLATVFLSETQDLKELDQALFWWKDIDYDSAKEFVEAQLQQYPDDIRYRYMQIPFIDDPLDKLTAARQLITDNTDFAGGYKALINTYLFDFDPYDVQDFYNDNYQILSDDIGYFLQYGYAYPGEEYATLALIYYHIFIGDNHTAQSYLSDAVENNETWMEELGLYNFFMRENSIELQKYHIGLLREKSDGYYDYLITYYADDLMTYYLDEISDYTAFIEFFGSEPYSWSQDIQIGLIRAYDMLEMSSEATAILTQNNKYEEAKEFQDYWLYSSSVECEEYYQKLLEGSTDPLHSYLKARILYEDSEKLVAARALVKEHPTLEYGYDLATQVHFTALSISDVNDQQHDELLSLVKQDIKLLRNYYSRFPKSKQATLAAIIFKAYNNDERGVSKVYKALLDMQIDDELKTSLAKIVIDLGEPKMLYSLKVMEAKYDVSEGTLEEEKADEYAITSYCEALYNNNYYDMLLSELDKHPDWSEYPNILFLTANTYYFMQDYTRTIATIRLLVESGAIGSTFLTYVESEDLLDHPDWQSLLDYAATMPDPDVQEEETIEDTPME